MKQRAVCAFPATDCSTAAREIPWKLSQSLRRYVFGRYGRACVEGRTASRRKAVLNSLIEELCGRCLSGAEGTVRRCFEELTALAVDVHRNDDEHLVTTQLVEGTVLLLLKIYAPNRSHFVAARTHRALQFAFGVCPPDFAARPLVPVNKLRGCFADEATFRHVLSRSFAAAPELLELGSDEGASDAALNDDEHVDVGRPVLVVDGDRWSNYETSVRLPVVYNEDDYDYEVQDWSQSPNHVPADRDDSRPGSSRGGGSGYGLVDLESDLQTRFGDASDMLTAVMNTVSANEQPTASLQDELCDLLGFENVDLMSSIIQNAHHLRAEFCQRRCNGGAPVNARVQDLVKRRPKPSGPAFGQQVTVKSERERAAQKELYKEQKRFRKQVQGFKKICGDANFQGNGDVMEANLAISELELAEIQARPIFGVRKSLPTPQSYRYVFDATANKNFTCSVKGGQMVLPEDSERCSTRQFEEIYVPGQSSFPPEANTPKIRVEDLDDNLRAVFCDLKQLNTIQSIVFKQAYGTNENLLICAPTGAGKTVTALLCIMRVVSNFTHGGVMNKKDFKIVYVAPMKALAAEVVNKMMQRLKGIGLAVHEMTGDVSLSKKQMNDIQVIVCTPEKWDVFTRKGTTDDQFVNAVRLVIFDEIHLLNDSRGAVVEAIVARTLRQIEIKQEPIRLVGLSATLPNYVDVAKFLHVNLDAGLFFFDGRFRPVPLSQTFIGVKETDKMARMRQMDTICYEKVLSFVRQGHQVLVFVHSRSATAKLATIIQQMASQNGEMEYFLPRKFATFESQRRLAACHNRQLDDLFACGLSIHHAGMPRQERFAVERLFFEGSVRVLCCTATLAWGVNLPAHAVIIRGTEVFDPTTSSFIRLNLLDVQQIFGRAGRPQFDTSGHGVIITSHDNLDHYLSLLTHQTPIESRLLENVDNHLNAEVSLGTVCSVQEAVEWLRSTYFYCRLQVNPTAYGVSYSMAMEDPKLNKFLQGLVQGAGRKLESLSMVRFDEKNGFFYPTHLGRMASYFYLSTDTVAVIKQQLMEVMTDDAILALVAQSSEFKQMKLRNEEIDELEDMLRMHCQVRVGGGVDCVSGKVNILFQSHLSGCRPNSFVLTAETSYVSENYQRILRALFEIAVKKGWALASAALLRLCKSAEHRTWWFRHPLWQFRSYLKSRTLRKIEDKQLTVERLKELTAAEVSALLRDDGECVKACVEALPMLTIRSKVQPITRTVLRVTLNIMPAFQPLKSVSSPSSYVFHIWIEDPVSNYIYHQEEFTLTRLQAAQQKRQQLLCTIPISEPLPNQYYVHWLSDRWIGCEDTVPLAFDAVILPDTYPPHTKLLDLQPLSVSALGDRALQSLYSFTHFNAVQTQWFFCLYHTDSNVLVGAPTGTGKTVAAEMAIFRVFHRSPERKCVYIAPLKALVKERVRDWKTRLEGKLGKRVVELTGDYTPEMKDLLAADVIVTTPEKWDVVSRSWQTRKYVCSVALIIIDEIHLLGEDRGPVLEVIVSRTNFICAATNTTLRIVGLSTALANADDLALWLGIKEFGLFNFEPSVRPVPLEVHISGYAERHYCPRMAKMNKPCFQAIKTHSPDKSVLIFVSSRKQTRLTSDDLISYVAGGMNPREWVHMTDGELEMVKEAIREPNLKLTLSFGIGMHHAGLHESDRRIVEDLFAERKIQVLIATATLAWGVNLPAHLVIIKGTEYFDGKTMHYIDFPITDVLQMIGRAGRPQFDDDAVAVIMVEDSKKEFYKKFLYEPLPVESSLLKVLADHLNAEIVSGTVTTTHAALDYLTWTYFFKRVFLNPSYYGLESCEPNKMNMFLSGVIQRTIGELEASNCVYIHEDGRSLCATHLGQIASYYYLSHKTVKMLTDSLKRNSSVEQLIRVLTSVTEYDEVPVRHSEDELNKTLAQKCPIPLPQAEYGDPHIKTHILYQMHFSRLQLPSCDYETDAKLVFEQAPRIMQAMLDVCADRGWLKTSLGVVTLMQMVYQGMWHHDPDLSILPHVSPEIVTRLRRRMPEVFGSVPAAISCISYNPRVLAWCSTGLFSLQQTKEIWDAINSLPVMGVAVNIKCVWDGETQANCVELQTSQTLRKANWLKVYADHEYLLSIELRRWNKSSGNRANTPMFPKAKDEGWIVILGDIEKEELMALKRTGPVSQKSTISLLFKTPEKLGRFVATLYVLSDCYRGLDQQYSLCFDVVASPIDDDMYLSEANGDVELPALRAQPRCPAASMILAQDCVH